MTGTEAASDGTAVTPGISHRTEGRRVEVLPGRAPDEGLMAERGRRADA